MTPTSATGSPPSNALCMLFLTPLPNSSLSPTNWLMLSIAQVMWSLKRMAHIPIPRIAGENTHLYPSNSLSQCAYALFLDLPCKWKSMIMPSMELVACFVGQFASFHKSLKLWSPLPSPCTPLSGSRVQVLHSKRLFIGITFPLIRRGVPFVL